MRPRFWFLKAWKLVQREKAEQYLLVVLLSFAASVSLTRLFLAVTGYPQLGNAELHIAHVLWGGLLLFIAAQLLLVLANRRVYALSAVLAGVGVGLFIDEVGKFITQHNDYFYPAAAPIIYVFFLMTLLIFLQIRRPPASDAHAELSRALEMLQEMLLRPLREDERARLEQRLEYVTHSSSAQLHANLAGTLLQFVRADERQMVEQPHGWLYRELQRASRVLATWLTDRRLRILLVMSMVGMGLLALKNPAFTFLSIRMPNLADALYLDFYLGRRVEAAIAPNLFQLRVKFEIGVGLLFLAAGGLLATGRSRAGVALAYLGLLLSLTSVDPLVFYFEQFSTILMAAFQFLLLIVLLYYRSRFMKSASMSLPYLEVIDKSLGIEDSHL